MYQVKVREEVKDCTEKTGFCFDIIKKKALRLDKRRLVMLVLVHYEDLQLGVSELQEVFGHAVLYKSYNMSHQ